MQFIEPSLLWGALAVAIPIAIHFWHQKRGKPQPWAATQWLVERDQQQSRGLRLDNILLLVVRCLLLVLLAFMLSQPLLRQNAQSEHKHKVHLVQPNALLIDNFKFELDEARKKGESVFWATKALEPFNDQSIKSLKPESFNVLTLQTALQQIDAPNTELHLYLINDQTLASVPVITVPAGFRLHTAIDSTIQPKAYLTGKDNKKLFVNRAGKLISSTVLDPGSTYQNSPAHTGPIRVLLNFRNQHERQTIKAALAALTDVYAFDLMIEEKVTPNQSYDWVLTDQFPVKVSPRTLYVLSGAEQPATPSNVIFTNEPLTPQTSDLVATGRLPEWLGERLIETYGLLNSRQPLSQQALQSLFVTTVTSNTAKQAGIQNLLLLLFVVLLAIERWLALTKNA
ncbi:BatA domain-containing protein [Spirosoma soli]|uniref:BatA domain-containing protein n=1 Tax=Spirosoma soli TaxID=1770529 RepID=A0ABW5LYM4_9BACT